MLPGPSCFFQSIVNAEAARSLAWWELLESLEEFAHKSLGRYQQEHAVGRPLLVKHRRVFVAPLEWVAPQIEEFREAQGDEGLLPDTHSLGALFHEMELPVLVPHRHQVAVVAPVKE